MLWIAFSVNAGLLAFAIDDQGEIRQIANETYTTSGGLLGRLGGYSVRISDLPYKFRMFSQAREDNGMPAYAGNPGTSN